jgi:Zn-finger nucleic acid-binding protein
MSYMNCPSCGLSIRLRASYLAIERCPRCLARRKVAVAMYLSQRPGGPPATDDSASPHEGARSPRDEARADRG